MIAVLVIFGIILQNNGVVSTLIVAPTNVVVMKGEKIVQPCTTNKAVPPKWYVCLPKSSNEVCQTIFNGYIVASNYLSTCAVKSGSPGQFNLECIAGKESANLYRCLEPGSLENETAQVIVLESHPTCYTTSVVDYVNITCVIQFYGHWRPAVEWRKCDNLNETVIKDDVTNFLSQYETVSTLTIMQKGSINATCYKVTCRFRKDERPAGVTAANIPVFDYTRCVCPPLYNASDCSQTPRGENISNSTKLEDKPIFNIAAVAIPSGIVAFILCVIVAVAAILYLKSKKKSKGSEKKPNEILLKNATT